MKHTMSQRVKYSRAHPLRNLWAKTSQKTPRKLTLVLSRKPHAPGLVALGDGGGVGVQSRAHCNSHILVNKFSLPCCKTNQHKHQQELGQSLGSAGSSQTSPTKKKCFGGALQSSVRGILSCDYPDGRGGHNGQALHRKKGHSASLQLYLNSVH